MTDAMHESTRARTVVGDRASLVGRARRAAHARLRPLVRLRPLARLAIVAWAWSCASAGMPPGGPEDEESPAIIRQRPDTNAINVRPGDAVTFNFDKVVSERPQNAPDLAGLFLISPSYGVPTVSWRRNMIAVRPRGGFRSGTTYTVRMLPGLADLQGNVDTVGRTVVFSTGPTIADGAMRGIVFDWLAEKVAPQAVIEAFPLPTPRDSTRYLAVADSTGRFELAHVPPGRYLLRASIDQNKNRFLDPREQYDTATITLADSVRREMLTYVRDTLGAGIQTVSIVDSLTLRVTMDRALDTALVIEPSRFSLKMGKDSVVIPIVRALARREYDRQREDSLKTKAIQDSVRAAARADSIRRADSTATPPPAAAPPPTRRVPPPRRAITRAADSLAGRDTSDREPTPKPSIPAPTVDIYLTLGTPLQPTTSYRLRAIDMRTLLRRSRSSDRVFTTPKPRPAPDSTKAQRDSAAARRARGARDTTAVRDTGAVRDTTPPDTTRRQRTARADGARGSGAAARRTRGWSGLSSLVTPLARPSRTAAGAGRR